MPLGDVTYQDAALDAVVGSWPASGAHYHLFVSDPALEPTPLDVELTSGGGYVAATFAPADFAAASGNAVATTAPVSFGTSTAAYDDTATFWGIVDSTGLLVFSNDLDDPIAVENSGTVVTFTPAISFGDEA